MLRPTSMTVSPWTISTGSRSGKFPITFKKSSQSLLGSVSPLNSTALLKQSTLPGSMSLNAPGMVSHPPTIISTSTFLSRSILLNTNDPKLSGNMLIVCPSLRCGSMLSKNASWPIEGTQTFISSTPSKASSISVVTISISAIPSRLNPFELNWFPTISVFLVAITSSIPFPNSGSSYKWTSHPASDKSAANI